MCTANPPPSPPPQSGWWTLPSTAPSFPWKAVGFSAESTSDRKHLCVSVCRTVRKKANGLVTLSITSCFKLTLIQRHDGCRGHAGPSCQSVWSFFTVFSFIWMFQLVFESHRGRLLIQKPQLKAIPPRREAETAFASATAELIEEHEKRKNWRGSCFFFITSTSGDQPCSNWRSWPRCGSLCGHREGKLVGLKRWFCCFEINTDGKLKQQHDENNSAAVNQLD